MSQVVPITDDPHFESFTSKQPSTILQVRYFHAPWAPPCAQMSTVLETLASTYPVADPPNIAFMSINAEELPDISEAHEVTAVPFVVLVRGAEILENIPGNNPAKVRDAVERHAGGVERIAKLPPLQEVLRPKEQPAPSTAVSSVSNAAAADPLRPKASEAPAKAKDLSAYAPGNKDDSTTAPAYTSTATPSLSAAPTPNANGDTESPKDLHTRLTQLTKAAPVMLFMKGTPSAPQCGFSRQLVSILRESSVRYGFFNILADEEVRQGLKEFADWPTFPQLWMGGELVGGLDIVKEELAADSSFFDEYSVDPSRRNQGGPAAAEDQAGSIKA